MVQLFSLSSIGRMSTKVSIPRWVACGGFGMCIGFLYFAGTLLLSHRDWYHKIGDGPAISQWLDAFIWVLQDFPFGHWIADGSLAMFCNGLFWGALGSGLYSFRLWRRYAA